MNNTNLSKFIDLHIRIRNDEKNDIKTGSYFFPTVYSFSLTINRKMQQILQQLCLIIF